MDVDAIQKKTALARSRVSANRRYTYEETSFSYSVIVLSLGLFSA